MKREDWTVTEKSETPMRPGQCFYCGRGFGDQHIKECVYRHRTVVVKIEMEMVMDFPETFDKKLIEYTLNESGRGGEVVLGYLKRMDDQNITHIYDIVEAEYLREATEDDERKQQLFVKELES